VSTAAYVPRLMGFGDTGADYGGRNLADGIPKGEVDTSKLNTGTLGGLVEFNNFETTIKDYVFARLGFPIVRVELTDFMVKICIDESINKLSYHAPTWMTNFAAFETAAGVNLYELPPHIMNNLTYIVYKKTLLSIQSMAGTLEFDFFIKYFQDNFLFNDFQIGDFFLLQQRLEMIRKILGQEGSFNVLNNKYINITPTPVINGQVVILEYRALNTDTIHPYYRNWIQRYSWACAKETLGQIRGKYASLPSPGGGAVLNGESLIQQAYQEKEQLVTELISEIEEPPVFTTM